MNKLIIIPITAVIFVLIDIYVFQAVKVVVSNFSPQAKKIVYYTYWGITVLTLLGFLLYNLANPDNFSRLFRNFMLVAVFINYFSKVFAVVFLMIDDVVRLGKWVVSLFQSNTGAGTTKDGTGISRSEFLSKAALIAGAVPFAAMSYGIVSGAHDYRIRRKVVKLPNLPTEFEGLKIVQLSDIHSGSFFNKTAVKGGVDMVLKEKPDLVFFTGDLVNNTADEIKSYIDVFSKVKAPMGVYSTLGNHDYGDYYSWSSHEAKRQNLKNLIAAHKEMNWDLLLNESRMLQSGRAKIAIIGVENWGAGRFSKYGNLSEAYRGTDDASVKLLLSHDPSHWDAEVRPKYNDIDMMFAGHTHGFQFGIEAGPIKWSPSQYVYKQWAGLYQEGSQYLYVNRGFGYLGFPGRIGMPPEITVIELRKV